MKGLNNASGVPERDSLALEFECHSRELYKAHKSLFLCSLCKNLRYCNKSGRYITLGLHEYSLACLAFGGVRCAKPSERLLTCVFTNAEGTFPTSAITEAEGILSLASSHRRAVCNAKPTSAPVSRPSSAPAPHAGQPKIANLFRLKAKGMPDGGRGAPTGDELSLVDDSYDTPPDTQIPLLAQTQQQQQSKVRSKSSRKHPRVEAGLSLPVMGTESQFSIPPSAESITDKRDHGNSMEDMLRRMELRMIEAQHTSEAKEARFLRTLSEKDDQIASLIAQMIGPPPVPTPVAGQTRTRSLQPQQSPPAAQSLRQPLQEGSYTRHKDNATRTDALPPRVHQQQPQLQPAPAKNKPLGKQPRMSYTVATAADKAAIADWIIGIRNGDMAPQSQREPVTYKSLYVNSYFVNQCAFCANPYSGLKQYLYGKEVLQTIQEVSFVGKGRTLAEVFIA
ncbi:hypothetical protein BC830DRAFT_1174156 [Chytriomyces sp. MP71]|nr:hypothetical protein BC830DRAFT_1174156 [Chytriomyces sp. MP71]